MRVFISKYALTKGIYEAEAEECSADGMILVKDGYSQYFHKGQWHSVKNDAIGKAREMRVKKLKSLEKQIKKIYDMKF